MSEHTPGPWFVGAMNDALFIVDQEPRPSTDHIAYSQSEHPLATIASLNMAWGRRTDAYARLMAAAPELLEALGSARDLISSTLAHVSHGGPTRADAEKVQVKIEAAIAKAKGEKQ